MDGYVQTGLGIFVSLILFIIGYRQTIGAKKERAKNANQSIHRSILRRMVLEDYAPLYTDITRVIEGKAREFRVSSNELRSEEQILNSLFTEVFDSDLISPSQRIEIEKHLNTCFEKLDEKPIKPNYTEFQQLTIEKREIRKKLTAMIILTSLLGATASVLPKILQTKTLQVEWVITAMGVLAASLVLTTTLYFLRKNKYSEPTSSKRSAQIISHTFEAEIAKTLKKNRVDFFIEPIVGKYRPDFLININDQNIAIEAKAWDSPVPLYLLRRTLELPVTHKFSWTT